jgi:hypothetical protein
MFVKRFFWTTCGNQWYSLLMYGCTVIAAPCTSICHTLHIMVAHHIGKAIAGGLCLQPRRFPAVFNSDHPGTHILFAAIADIVCSTTKRCSHCKQWRPQQFVEEVMEIPICERPYIIMACDKNRESPSSKIHSKSKRDGSPTHHPEITL